MGNKPKTKMSVSDRAKQFMPFAALKGLPEALSAKEKIIVDKHLLTEEQESELDFRIRQLAPGAIATIIYYSDGEYIQITGRLARIDPASRLLQIVNTRISFDDIYDIIAE